MQCIRNNQFAEQFDRATHRLITAFDGDDELVLLIALNLLVRGIIRQQANWPEDILGFADHIQSRLDPLSDLDYLTRLPLAKQYLDQFLDQDDYQILAISLPISICIG